MRPYATYFLLFSILVFSMCGCSSEKADGTSDPAAILTSISVSPAGTSISDGTAQQFIATGTYSDSATKDITASVTWVSSDSSVATINTSGMASAVSAGTTTIAAATGALATTIKLTVTNATLISIVVSPADPQRAQDSFLQFTAAGMYSDSTTQDISTSVTWTSSDTTVATIDATGLSTCVSPGITTITASTASGGITGTSTLTVTDATLNEIDVTPADPQRMQGSSLQFTAIGTYSDFTTQDVTTAVTWDSSDTTIATINATGLSTCVNPGSTTITATAGTVSGNVTLTVLEMLNKSPFGFHPAAITTMGYTNNGYGDATTLGVAWTRLSYYFYWHFVQQDLNDPAYDFSLFDTKLGNIPPEISILANIAPQGINNDQGYSLPNSFMPIDTAKYTAFVKASVERYDGDGIDDMPGLANPIKYWQVGNEPSIQQAADFDGLQRVTYTAIKEACPGCIVLIGGTSGMPPAIDYIDKFDRAYKPILDALGGQYVDIMDFHWYGNATGDYLGAKQVYDHVNSMMSAAGFISIPVWITEMGSYSGDPLDSPPQTEREQALDYFKRFVYSLSFGIQKIFPAFGLMEVSEYSEGFFDFTGLIYDGVYAGDPGLGVKKLSYYTYQKMTELLEGSEWSSIQVVRESGDVYIYRFSRNNTDVYVAWWDYFNDPAYVTGDTLQVPLAGLSGSSATITVVVPSFVSGAEVTDYATAFSVTGATVDQGALTLTLGDSPVVVELVP